MKLLALMLLSGCSIKADIVKASFSATLLKEEQSQNTFNVQSGNQSSLEEANSNPIYESQKYKQLKNEKVSDAL